MLGFIGSLKIALREEKKQTSRSVRETVTQAADFWATGFLSSSKLFVKMLWENNFFNCAFS